MPLFSREKSSLKGHWRLETVQDMRSSSSNPVSCSETPIKIYGSKEEIRAQKSPETVDAPGFAPDASIPVILFGAAGRIRTADLILTKKPWLLLRRTHSCRERTSNPLRCKGLEVLIMLVSFNTYRGVLCRFRVFVGRIVGKQYLQQRRDYNTYRSVVVVIVENHIKYGGTSGRIGLFSHRGASARHVFTKTIPYHLIPESVFGIS